MDPSTVTRVAALLTWVAVACAPVLRLVTGQAPLGQGQLSLMGLVGLGAVPILYLLSGVRFGRAPLKYRRWWVLLEAPAVLMAYWGLNDSTQPALLVIVASQFLVAFGLPTATLLLIATNVAFLVMLLARFGALDVITMMVIYGCFQAFAVMTITFAQRANETRDALLRINAELLATRQLLLESTRSEERLRLSRELHDVVGHKLTALKLQLRLHRNDNMAASRTSLEDCARLADELLTDVREVVDTLRHDDGIDLHRSLKALAPALPQPQIDMRLAPEARVTHVEQAHALLRCAQEGLTNALRHSGASRIVISLTQSGGGVTLCVEDDGPSRSAPAWGNGLTGMQERLQSLGGRLEVTALAEHGLLVTAWLPQDVLTETGS